MNTIERFTSHNPLIELTIDTDGTIYSLSNGRKSNKVMDIPAIKITAKAGFDRTDNHIKYKFEINNVTDAFWRSLFVDIISLDLAHVHGSRIDITCEPSAISKQFQAVKIAIDTVNQKYEKAKPIIRELAEDQDTKRNKKIETEAHEEEQKKCEIQTSYDDLEI